MPYLKKNRRSVQNGIVQIAARYSEGNSLHVGNAGRSAHSLAILRSKKSPNEYDLVKHIIYLHGDGKKPPRVKHVLCVEKAAECVIRPLEF